MRPMPDFIQNGLADLRQLNMTTISETCVRYRHFSLAKPAPRIYNGVRNTQPIIVREEVKIPDKPQRRVTEIRVYYDDQTWESFVPSKK